ncbi:defensin-like [Dermacentor andersoni]|uniref:defensin-like n=1 Tax=Dermacentor andersoni TaxID=34620 RepID=UPI003B3A6B99
MKVLVIALIFTLVSGILATASLNEDKSEVAHLRVRRWGFGCPFNQRACHRHCRSIRRRAGYCGGRFKLTCICVRR